MVYILLLIVTLFLIRPVEAAQWYVNPVAGSDTAAGTSETASFKTIQKGIDVAQAGDVINLADGVYLQDAVSKRHGVDGSPITIRGSLGAVVSGAGAARIFEINHDHIVMSGFTIDGHWNQQLDSKEAYRDKLIYVIGKETKEGVNGLKILNMKLKNAGGECVRIRYFSHDNEVAQNSITNCGVHDYRFDDGGKNGEAVYLGTAPEQRGQNGAPTADPDITKNNHIHDNTMNTQGNECVDIKEDSTANIVEGNDCTGQKDPESGGFDSRGSGNTFRNNKTYGNMGAGIRLGGDTAQDGLNNNIYNNEITNNAAGGIKFMRSPQAKICGNTMSGNTGGDSVGTFKSQFNPTAPCQAEPSLSPTSGTLSCREGDTNGDGKVTLADYETWRQVFKSQ